MDYQHMVISGFIMFVGIMLLILKTGHWRKILPYHWYFDATISLLILFYMQGSWAGQIGAGLTGIMLSITFSILHMCFKPEKPRVVKRTTYIGPFELPYGSVEWYRAPRGS
jgi:hypothetical protein